MQYLQKRGVTKAAQHMNITPERYYDNTPGFAIPVQDMNGARVRFRAIDTTADGHKTKWFGKSGSYTPKYYYPPEVQDAITAANGKLIIASGEFDLLTFVEIGWLNVVSFASENSIPNSLVKTLQAWNVRHVDYWIDNDAAGAKSARRVQDTLANSGITFNAYSLAAHVPEKGDTNDLWQLLNFDRDQFIHALQSAPLAELPASDQPKKPLLSPKNRVNIPLNIPDFVRDVINALMNQPKAKDKRDQIICTSPFREDNNPSFSFSKSKLTGYDFGTGQGYGVVEIGRAFGIDIRDYMTSPLTLSSHQPKAFYGAFTPHLTINQRYTSEMDIAPLLAHRATLIKSGLGTGKTALAARLIEQLEQGGKYARVLIVSHRRSLVGNLAGRFEAEVYESIPTKHLSSAPRLAITVDSLHKIDPSRRYDLIIMDECEQVLRHLNGGTLKGKETTTAYERLRTLIQSAGHVLALDAHASDATSTWLKSLVGDVLKVENVYQHEWGTLEFHDRPETIIHDALATIQAQPDQTHVIITSSRRNTELYRQIFAETVGDDAVMMVNAWNSESTDVQHFLYNINMRINDYRVVIASPSIASGVDVTAPIASVWGVFTARPLLPSDMMQMLMRYRNAQHRAVTVQPSTSDKLITDSHILYEAEIKRYQGTTQAIMDNTPPLSDILREGARLMASFTADDNLQRADVRAAFLALAAGFQIKPITREAPAMREMLKAARQAMKDRIKAQVIAAKAISKERLNALRQGGADITHEIRFGHERWKIEDLIGGQITEQLYDDLHTRQLRAALRLFAALDAQPDDLREIDRVQVNQNVWLAKREHITRKIQTVQALIKRVFPGGLDAAEQLTEAQITERMGDLGAVLADLRLYFEDRADYSERPVPVLRRLLAAIGLKLESKQIQRDGVRFMLYWIDAAHLIRWRMYAKQVNRPKNTEDETIISVNLGGRGDNPPDAAVLVMESPPDVGWMAEIVF